MKIKWLTMPIPEVGATFAFKTNLTVDEFYDVMKNHPELEYSTIREYGTIVYLIGHVNSTDHIATYVPSTSTLFTSTREAFR